MKIVHLTRVTATKNDQQNKTFNHEQYVGMWLQRQRMWNVRLRAPGCKAQGAASHILQLASGFVLGAPFHPQTALELCSRKSHIT